MNRTALRMSASAILAVSAGSCSRDVQMEVDRVAARNGKIEVYFSLPDAPKSSDQLMGRAVARLYVCGNGERFESRSDVRRHASGFVAEFPLGLSERTEFQPSGKISRGWPQAVALQNGTCFRAGVGDMAGRRLETNEVKVRDPGLPAE